MSKKQRQENTQNNSPEKESPMITEELNQPVNFQELSPEEYTQLRAEVDQQLSEETADKIRRGVHDPLPVFLGNVEEDLALSKANSPHFKFQAEAPIPMGRGKPAKILDHVVQSPTNPWEFGPRLPADVNAGIWRGFMLKEDRLGSRYLPVAMPWEVVEKYCVDPSGLNMWDTRVSQASRIEGEIVNDIFTLWAGPWAPHKETK
jgi:hypothetical protein